MSDEHANSRSTLMFNTAAFSLSSIALGIALILDLFKGQMFSSVVFAGLYVGLGLVPFRSAWKGFADMDYSKANFRGYLSWLSTAGAAALAFLT